MALSIGELVGYVGLDTEAMEGGLERVKGMLGDAGGSWGKVLGGAGAVGGGLFAASLVGAMDVEQSTDKLSAQLGLTADESERIGGVAGDLFANAYGDSMEQTSEAVGAVVSSIKGMRNASSSALQTMTADALNFASAFDVDVSRAVQVAGQLINTGLAKNGTEAMDLLTKTMQEVPAAVREDVLDAADEYGPFFKTLGMTGAEAMGVLAKGAQKGMYGIDKAGDAIKEFTIRATDGSDLTGSAMAALGLNAKDMGEDIAAGGKRGGDAFQLVIDRLLAMKDPLAQSKVALKLFGTPMEDLNVSEIPKFLKGLDAGSAKLRGFKGATAEMGNALNDNASTNLTQFWRTIKMRFVEVIGGAAIPAVNKLTHILAYGVGPAFDLIGHAAGAAGGFLEDHGTIAKVLGGIIAAVLLPRLIQLGVQSTISAGKQVVAWTMTQGAAIKGAIVQAGALATTAAKWVWTAAQATASAVRMAAAWIIAMGPIAIVIAAVVGLAVLIIAKWDLIKKVTSKAWSAVVGFVKKHAKLILIAVTGPIGALVLFVIKHWDKIKQVTSNAVSAVVGFVKSIPGKFKQGLSSLGSVLSGAFSTAMNAAKSKVVGIGGEVVSWISGIPGKLLNLVGRFGNAGHRLIQAFVDGMKNASGIITGIAGNVWDAVSSLLNGAIDQLNAALDFEISIPGPNVHVNLPDIPHLATGGRATKGQLAVIGEGREPETVLPDSLLRGLLERVHKAGEAMGRRAAAAGDGPLIGAVYQQPGESTDQLAERLWFKTKARGY